MENNKNKSIDSQFVLTDEISRDVAKIIIQRIETFNPQRRRQLIEIKANISYLVGYQDIELIHNNIVPITDSRAINSIANVILPAVQKDIAVATSNPPIFDIVPAGTDDDDKATALLGTKLFKYIQRRTGKDIKRAQTVMWYDIAGVGWRKTYWDPHFTVIGVNPTPQDENGEPNPEHNPNIEIGSAITEGEVCIESIPPNQLIYDYRASDLNKLDWIIHAKSVTADWVLNTFGSSVYNKLKTQFSSSVNSENQFEAKIMSSFSNLTQGTQSTATEKMSGSSDIKLESDKFIDYYEYWHKPTNQMPTGMFAVMLGKQVVAHSEYPKESYPHGELPFTPSAPMSIESVMPAAISRVSQARPLQREYNRLRSQIAENIDIMGNSVLIASRQAKLRYKKLSNGAGNIIEYDGPSGRPQRESGIPMNSQIFVYLNETKQAINEIFAFHDPSRGMAPKNVDSGRGLEALQGADMAHLGPMIKGFEEADEKVAYQALTIAIANYEPGRMINVVGDDYSWTTYEIDAKQLRGKFNVIVKPNSSMPKNKDREAAQAFEIWQSGLMGNPNDPEIRTWTMEQMQAGNADNILQKSSKQRNFAKKEFLSAVENMKKMPPITEDMPSESVAKILDKFVYIPHTNTFDDHLLHIQVHNEYLMDNFWELRSSGNPIVFEMINRMKIHVQEHQQIVAESEQMQFNQQLQAQMLIKGKTPEQILLSQINNKKQNEKGKKDE